MSASYVYDKIGYAISEKQTMTEKIKLTSDELRLMSLFQNVTSATARDCIVDTRMDRVIFVVNKGQMGLAIGKEELLLSSYRTWLLKGRCGRAFRRSTRIH